jgi:hypothetical protein
VRLYNELYNTNAYKTHEYYTDSGFEFNTLFYTSYIVGATGHTRRRGRGCGLLLHAGARRRRAAVDVGPRL